MSVEFLNFWILLQLSQSLVWETEHIYKDKNSIHTAKQGYNVKEWMCLTNHKDT